MRFSLKWILAAMVYVAIATAAFSQLAWLYSDTLWGLSILSNVYAATLAWFARGPRKAAAIAFVLASVSFATFALVNIGFAGYLSHGGFFPIDDLFFVLGIDANHPDPNALLRLRAANALATLVFGLMGSLVGLIAFRSADHRSP